MAAGLATRNVVLYSLLSLDGVAEAPGDWLSDGGREMFDNLGGIIETQDDVLLGRGTYDYWVGYWPTSEIEPFASFINGVRKHVVTSSEPGESWANSALVGEPVVDYVERLKGGSGGDIGVHGSISLAQSLLQAGLIDELRLVIAPTLAGSGRRLFAEGDAPERLVLEGVDRSEAGTLFLTYRRTG
jgi:dihydrofolate reductase